MRMTPCRCIPIRCTPVSSVPNVIRRLNNALVRADQIQHMQGKSDIHWFAPIVADAEAGFGGPLNTFELIKDDLKQARRRCIWKINCLH